MAAGSVGAGDWVVAEGASVAVGARSAVGAAGTAVSGNSAVGVSATAGCSVAMATVVAAGGVTLGAGQATASKPKASSMTRCMILRIVRSALLSIVALASRRCGRRYVR